MSLKTKYLYNGDILDEDALHHSGIIISDTEPVATTVYGLGSYDGQTAVRHTGSNGDCLIKTATAIVYYATQSACDTEWTTEELVQEILVWTNTSQSLTMTTRLTTNPNYQAVEKFATLYNEQGNTFSFSSSKTYQITKWYDGTEWKDNDLFITAENHYVYPSDLASAKLGAYNTTIYASAFKYTEI